jgi:hypothetical protein
MPKSILKKYPVVDRAVSIPIGNSQEEHNRETALYHANLLQQRKDVEAVVLTSTETLLDFPSTPDSNPAKPSNRDASTVRHLLKSFQPSDYDALIEERNIDRKCGYLLCPRANRLEDTNAKLRILQSRGKGADAFRVVESRTMERWCSDRCGKRALYIKVQLNEDPAWTRASSVGDDIALLEDSLAAKQDQEAESRLAEGLEKLEIGLGEERVIAAMKELAIERGDGDAVGKASRLVKVGIHENRNAAVRELSSPAASSEICGPEGLYDSIEGYKPKFSSGKTPQMHHIDSDDDGKDIIPTI